MPVATRGKHGKAPDEGQSYGKHAADVRIGIDFTQVAISLLLLAALAIIPFSFNRMLVAMDSQAFADATKPAGAVLAEATQTAVKPLAAAAAEATELVKAGAIHAPSAVEAIPEAEVLRAALPAVGYTERVGEKRQASLMDGGCELVSLAIVLDALGFNPDIHGIVEDHLTIDGHFATGYTGDPYHLGGGYPAGIADAANGYLAAQGSSVRAHDITGAAFDSLEAYVQKGYPVMVWTTMGFTDPVFTGVFDDGREWYSNEHCAVMYGIENGKVLVSDPMDGLIERDADRFAEIYGACGSMAMVLL